MWVAALAKERLSQQPQSALHDEHVSPATRSHRPSPQDGHARLHTMMSPAHEIIGVPPEHSAKVQLVAPPQYARHAEPPVHVVAQPVAPSQLTSHEEPPVHVVSQSVTFAQST